MKKKYIQFIIYILVNMVQQSSLRAQDTVVIKDTGTLSKKSDKGSQNKVSKSTSIDTCKCDKNNPEIIYDFLSKKFICDVEKIKFGKGLNFKVINFPRLVYDGKASFEIHNFSTSAANNPLADQLGLRADEISEAASNNSKENATSDKKTNEIKTDTKEALVKTISNIDRSLDSIAKKKSSLIKDPKVKTLTNLKEDLTCIKNGIDSSNCYDSFSKSKQVFDLIPDKKNLKGISKELEELEVEIRRVSLVNQLNNYKTDFDSAVDVIDRKSTYYTFDNKSFNQLMLGCNNSESIRSRINKIFDFDVCTNCDSFFKKQYRDAHMILIALKNNYKKINRLLDENRSDFEAIFNGAQGLADYKVNIHDTYETLQSGKLDEVVLQVRNLIDALINPANYEINFGKFMAYGDEVEINFSNTGRNGFRNNSTNDFGTPVISEPDHDFPKIIEVYDYWSLDFSTGLIGNNIFSNENVYHKIDLDNDSVRIEEYHKTNNLNIGLSALVHILYACNPTLKIGFSVGGGINSNNELSGSYLAGGTMALRVLHKAIVSFNLGCSFAPSPILKEKYAGYLNEEHKAVFAKSFVEENYTENRLKPGWYFGISFNLLSVTVSKNK